MRILTVGVLVLISLFFLAVPSSQAQTKEERQFMKQHEKEMTTFNHSVFHPQPHQHQGRQHHTLGDPVEYPMNMIRQTSVNEAAKMDFANGIRSMMRQDPDIILVGEIRDRETAEMAFSAAMTGHQVYTTLHTNSAVGVIPRLLDIGILPDIMSGIDLGSVAGDSAADQRDLRPGAAHRLRQGPEDRRSPSRQGCHQGYRTGVSDGDGRAAAHGSDSPHGARCSGPAPGRRVSVRQIA